MLLNLMTCCITVNGHYYYTVKAGAVVIILCVSVILSVSSITLKLVNGRRPNMVGMGKG